MPWTAKSASTKTAKADTPAKKKRWAAVANSALRRTGNDGLAIREANGVVAKMAEGGRPSVSYSGSTDSGGYNRKGVALGSHQMDLAIPVSDDTDLTGTAGYSPNLYGRGNSDIGGMIGLRTRFASGGLASLNSISYADKNFERGTKSGFIHSLVPGRTDRLPMSVKANSFVVPADIVSGMGQGNSAAGAHILGQITKAPYGASMPTSRGHLSISKPRMADGGKADKVQIVGAGGEMVIPPEDVAHIGGGDLEKGHKILAAMVDTVRKQVAKRLLKLKPTKK